MDTQDEQSKNNDVEFVDVESDEAESDDNGKVVPFVPGKSNVEDDSEMVQDDSAYVMYHQAQTGWLTVT